MRLHHLRSFVEAVDLGSFTAAARSLSYSGPAISQHVAALEAEIGVDLLNRHARGVKPTPAGEILLARARQLIATADGIAEDVRRAVREPPKLTIGAFPTAAQHVVAPILGAFRRSHPATEVVLIDREPPEGYLDVLSGELDLLVTHHYPGMPSPDTLGLHVQRLTDERLVCLVREDHPASSARSIEELSDATWISGPAGRPNRAALDALAVNAGFEPKVGFETTDYSVTVTLAQSGLGPTFVPLAVAGHQDTDGLVELELAGTEMMARRICTVHNQPARSQALQHVLSDLHRHNYD